MTHCIIIGGDATVCGGVYVLWIHVAAPLNVVFGRFRGGQPIAVPAGDYFYVGSALGGLAGRLLRHATRGGVRPPQAIRDQLAWRLAAAGLAARRPTAKRRRWHVDYLLDEMDVALVGVWAWRTAEPLEGALAEWLAAQAGVVPLAAGLGASDDRGRTHLLRVADSGWNTDDVDWRG